MANVVGVLLIALIVVAVPLKYFADMPTPVLILGTAHGWLYFLFFLSAIDLALRAKWTPQGDGADRARRHRAVPVLLRRADGDPEDPRRRTRVTAAGCRSPSPLPDPPRTCA